jgi:hypothetical protein
MRGIKIEVPDLTQWKAERVFLGLDVPDDLMELKYLWIYTEVIGTIEDLSNIRKGVEIASGVSEEEISATEALFRDSVGQSHGNGTERPTAPPNGSGVVLQPTLSASASGARARHDGKRVRRAKS